MNVFSTAFRFDGPGTPSVLEPDTVVRRAKVFEAGAYPDKGPDAVFTPEDLAAAVSNFTEPVMIDAGHPTAASPLDGRLGYLETLELGEDGKSLWGNTRTPKWVDAFMEGTNRAVSTLWSRPDKRLLRLSLVNEGHVPDARLGEELVAFARGRGIASEPELGRARGSGRSPDPNSLRSDPLAFAAKHNTRHGQQAMQEIHDAATRAGAVCTTGNIAMASRHEASAIQQIHDLTTDHGASCDSLAPSKSPWGFAAPAAPPPAKEKRVNIKDLINRWHAKGQPDEFKPEELLVDAAGEAVPSPAGSAPAATPALAAVGTTPAPDPEKVAMQKQIDELRVENIKSAAIAFSNGLIFAGKLRPERQESVNKRFVELAQADAQLNAIAFAAGQTPASALLAGYKAELEAAPAHGLDREALKGHAFSLPNLLQTPGVDASNGDAVKQAEEAARKYAERMNKSGTK